MIAIPESRAETRAGSKAFPFRYETTGRPFKRARVLAAAAAAALVGYAGVAVADLGDVRSVEQPAERIALVIGNGEYEGMVSDPSVAVDAAGTAAALERLGFEVRHLENAGYVDMLRSLLEFSQAAQSARDAVVYYVGPYGIAIDGRSFLVPVDAGKAVGEWRTSGGTPGGKPDHELIPVAWLVRSVGGASNLRLAILDAHVGAPLKPVEGTIVAMAATVGSQPLAGPESFTQALLRHLEEPDLDLGTMFRRVRDDMMMPWTTDTTTRLTEGGREREPVVYGLPGLIPPDPARDFLWGEAPPSLTW